MSDWPSPPPRPRQCPIASNWLRLDGKRDWPYKKELFATHISWNYPIADFKRGKINESALNRDERRLVDIVLLNEQSGGIDGRSHSGHGGHGKNERECCQYMRELFSFGFISVTGLLIASIGFYSILYYE